MKYRPKLDPKVDLAGATPETLARALLRNRLRPRGKRKTEPPEDNTETQSNGDD